MQSDLEQGALLEEYDGLGITSEEESIISLHLSSDNDSEAHQEKGEGDEPPQLDVEREPLSTNSTRDRFNKACQQYGVRHDYDRMVDYYNENMWRKRKSSNMRPISFVDIARKFVMLDDASRLLKNQGFSGLTRSSARRKTAKEVNEDDLRVEEEHANELNRQEERDARAVDLGRPRRCLSHYLLKYENLQKMAARITGDENAMITGPAFTELAAMIVNWMRKIIKDVLLHEDEFRWGLGRQPMTDAIHMSSIQAALLHNGIDFTDLHREEGSHKDSQDVTESLDEKY